MNLSETFYFYFPPSPIVFPAIQLKLNLSETFLLYSLSPILCPILSNSNIYIHGALNPNVDYSPFFVSKRILLNKQFLQGSCFQNKLHFVHVKRLIAKDMKPEINLKLKPGVTEAVLNFIRRRIWR